MAVGSQINRVCEPISTVSRTFNEKYALVPDIMIGSPFSAIRNEQSKPSNLQDDGWCAASCRLLHRCTLCCYGHVFAQLRNGASRRNGLPSFRRRRRIHLNGSAVQIYVFFSFWQSFIPVILRLPHCFIGNRPENLIISAISAAFCHARR